MTSIEVDWTTYPEELPTEDVTVLVWVHQEYHLGFYDGSEFFIKAGGYCDPVTHCHWRSLPMPPQKENTLCR